MLQDYASLAPLRQRMAHYLKLSGKTRAELAEYLGLSEGWLSMFFAGTRPIQSKLIPRAAEFLRVPLSTLHAEAEAEDESSLPFRTVETEDRNAAAPRRRHPSPTTQDPIHFYQREIREERAHIRHLERALEHEQAETAHLRRMLRSAQTQLYSMHEWLNAVTQTPAAHAADARTRDARPASVRPPRTGRR